MSCDLYATQRPIPTLPYRYLFWTRTLLYAHSNKGATARLIALHTIW